MLLRRTSKGAIMKKKAVITCISVVCLYVIAFQIQDDSSSSKYGIYKLSELHENVREGVEIQENAKETLQKALEKLKELNGISSVNAENNEQAGQKTSQPSDGEPSVGMSGEAKSNEAQKTDVSNIDVIKNFSTVVTFDGKIIENKYLEFYNEMNSYQNLALEYRNKHGQIVKVTNDILAEWKNELGQYRIESYRKKSQEDLSETEKSYKNYINKFENKLNEMDGRLVELQDCILLIKHKLYGRTVIALDTEVNKIIRGINELITQINELIKEVNLFRDALERDK